MMFHKTPGNVERLAQLPRVWEKTLAEVLREGFHGTAYVEISVTDGTIQVIRRRVEEIETLPATTKGKS